MWFDRLLEGLLDTLLMVGVSSLIALLVGVPMAVLLVTSDKGGIFEAPLLNAQRAQTGWMSAFIDISEQRRIEERRVIRDNEDARAGLNVVLEPRDADSICEPQHVAQQPSTHAHHRQAVSRTLQGHNDARCSGQLPSADGKARGAASAC